MSKAPTTKPRTPLPRKTAAGNAAAKTPVKRSEIRDPRGATLSTVDNLRRMLLDGTLGGGEQIRQEEMAEMLSVSRVPLREALNVLASEGLLQHRLNAGYFVPKRTPAEVRQLVRMVSLLEDELLLTMEWPNADLLQDLRGLNASMREATEQRNWPQLAHLNRDFHFRVFDLSNERLILAEVQRLWMLASSVNILKLADLESARRTLVEHDAIIDALKKRNRDLCLKRMSEHRLSTHSVLLKLDRQEA